MQNANQVIAYIVIWASVIVLLGCGITLAIVTTVRMVRRGRTRTRP